MSEDARISPSLASPPSNPLDFKSQLTVGFFGAFESTNEKASSKFGNKEIDNEQRKQANRQSTGDQKPVKRLTYLQTEENKELELKHDLFALSPLKEGFKYDKYDSLVLCRLIDDLNNNFRTEKVFIQQYILQKGLLKFRDCGYKAAMKEAKQLHD